MSAATPVPLTPKSQKAFMAFYSSVQSMQNTNRLERRSYFEEIDRQYQREMDQEAENKKAKAANTMGETSRYQNITVPVVMPQVEAAVTYQTSVFLTGYPLFGVVSDPAFMTEAMQLESIIEEQSTRNGWARQFILFFRDGFKYNFAPLEVDWTSEVSYSVDTALDKSISVGVPKEIIWSGNKITRLDPYNTFVDHRVPPTEVYKDGEFAGYTRFMSRIKLKEFIARLPDKIISNLPAAFASNGSGLANARDAGALNYYVPDINPASSEHENLRGGTNWLNWAGLSSTRNQNLDYKDSYELTTLYAKILPSEFDLRVPNSNTPQIYKLYIVNHEHIIYAELQTNAHTWLPILIGQPLEDGLAYQTKSLAENGVPFQEVTSAYMNSILASRRRAITDRVLYDPSRITSAHINSPNPSAKIPVRPAAYGKNIGESVYAFPYREDQAGTSIQQIQMLLGLANELSGQNRVSQGQFQKGNKTLQEFQDVMANANGRDQMASILMEHQVFVPLKHMLKINILQFQGGTTIYNRDKQRVVEVDPLALRKAVLDFKISDGIIPSSKLINAEAFATSLQVFGSSPQIAQGYNVAQVFSYLMKTQGADLSVFEKSQQQLAYEQAVGAWQQMMQLAIEKGMEMEEDGSIPGFPPQPTPQQFGYDPGANNPAAPKKDQIDQPTSTQQPSIG